MLEYCIATYIPTKSHLIRLTKITLFYDIFRDIHRSRRTGPNLMKGNCAFQKRKICGFNDKYPSKSINFVSLNFTIETYLPLDIISLNFFCSSWFTNSPWTQTLYRHEDIALHTWWIIKILLKNKFCSDFTAF